VLHVALTLIAAGAAPQSRVLVLDLEATGVPPAVATQVTDLVAQAVGSHGAQVLTASDVRAVLDQEQMHQLVGCGAGAVCAPVGPALQADRVIAGSVGMIGMRMVVSLALIDPASATVLARATGELAAEQLAGAVRSTVASLLGAKSAGGNAFALPAGRAPSFAVLDLVAAGVPPESVATLGAIVAEELVAIRGARVVGRDDIRAMLALEANKQLAGCDDVSCLAEIGGALGVDYLVAGSVGMIGEVYVVGLRLIEPQRASVASRVSESFTGRPEQLVGAVRHAARRLTGIDGGAGALALTASEPDASLFLDGKEVGPLPPEGIGALPAGRHSVRLAKPDFADWASDVYVQPGAPTALTAELIPLPSRWWQSPWLWTGVGVVLAGGGLAAYLLWPEKNGGEDTHGFGLEVGLPQR
jgi:hypothetical protein